MPPVAERGPNGTLAGLTLSVCDVLRVSESYRGHVSALTGLIVCFAVKPRPRNNAALTDGFGPGGAVPC
jgi:hypothetical protein